MSRPASPQTSVSNPPTLSESVQSNAFHAEHPALERLKISEPPADRSSYPVLERRDTLAETNSGSNTPRRLSASNPSATEFPPLEKRTTHLADEDEFAIM